MKFSALFAITGFVGVSFLLPSQVEAGRLYSLLHNIGISRNNGNPRMVITDGSKLIIFYADDNRNPLDNGGEGFRRIYNLDSEGMSTVAEFLQQEYNCIDTLEIKGSSLIDKTYDQAMFMSC